MPFGDAAEDPEEKRKLDHIYNEWIYRTVVSVPVPGEKDICLTCYRADKEVRPGDIITHVIEALATADVVIADLTGQNANVFYELGVRHAIRNNTILIAQDINDIPFDLRGQRMILYKYDPEHLRNLERDLKAALLKIATDTEKIDNPVRRFLCDKAIEDLTQRAVPPGYDGMRTILNEMENLKREVLRNQKQVHEVMQLVTSMPQDIDQSTAVGQQLLKEFQGIWESSSGGTYCARLVDDRLYIPYSYSGLEELTGHYYQCTAVGNSIFGRFRWFESHISGYAAIKIENNYLAKGGWWFSDNVPPELRSDISRIDDSLPQMNELTWTKNKGKKRFPKWAEEYFTDKRYLLDDI
jgi:hypothetical protein